MLGLLRSSAHPIVGQSFTSLACQLSTFPLLQPRHTRYVSLPLSLKRRLAPLNSQNSNLGSIFSRNPAPSPYPLIVVHMTRLEAEANVQPQDVEKQLALFRTLMETKLKTSYELVINWWEQVCKFVGCRDSRCERLRWFAYSGLRTLFATTPLTRSIQSIFDADQPTDHHYDSRRIETR